MVLVDLLDIFPNTETVWNLDPVGKNILLVMIMRPIWKIYSKCKSVEQNKTNQYRPDDFIISIIYLVKKNRYFGQIFLGEN